MGRAKNTLSAQDVSSTPIKVQYSATYPSNSLQDYGITIRSGSNIPYSASMPTAQLEDMNNYRVVKQLYYQYYLTGSLLNSASCWDPVWQSTAASGSGDSMNYYFPTGSYENIVVLTIPASQFGEQISRNSFAMSASDSSYYIKDDGNGNLIDTVNSNTFIGNIFYAQGVIIITNQDYTIPATYLATEDYDVYNTQNDVDITIQ